MEKIPKDSIVKFDSKSCSFLCYSIERGSGSEINPETNRNKILQGQTEMDCGRVATSSLER